MTQPSHSSGRHAGRQSGRHAIPPTSQSSVRLAAQYNLEHDPVQSDQRIDDGNGGGFLHNLAGSRFAVDRFSASVILIIIVAATLVSIIFMSDSLMDMIAGSRRSDLHPTVIGNPSEAEERRNRFEQGALERPPMDVNVLPADEQRG